MIVPGMVGIIGGVSAASGGGVVSDVVAGVASYVNNGGITPVNPSHQAGDKLIAFYFLTQSKKTVSVAGAGWAAVTTLTTALTNRNIIAVSWLDCAGSSEANPVFSVASPALNETAMAIVIRVRGAVTGAPSFGAVDFSSNATVLPFVTGHSVGVGGIILAVGNRNDDCSAVSTLAGATAGVTWNELAELSTTAGADGSGAIDYAINASGSSYNPGTGASVTFTGGSASHSIAVYMSAEAA